MHKFDQGIYIYDNKTFYYLEAGDNYIGNKLERVRKALIQRELIQPILNTNYSKSSYDIIDLTEAEKRGYKKQPIFLSKHIKTIHEAKKKDLGSTFK
jgi:hypothetical protein